MDWQRKCMTQVELRDENPRWCRQAAVRRRVEYREQYGRGDQCTAWRCAVVCPLDHVVHKGSTKLEYEGVVTSFSGVFTEGRCKVYVDSGTGSFLLDTNGVMVEAGDAMDVDVIFEEFIQRCLREFWKKQGLRVDVNIRMSQDAAGPLHVTVEGSEGSRQQRKEQ